MRCWRGEDAEVGGRGTILIAEVMCFKSQFIDASCLVFKKVYIETSLGFFYDL